LAVFDCHEAETGYKNLVPSRRQVSYYVSAARVGYCLSRFGQHGRRDLHFRACDGDAAIGGNDTSADARRPHRRRRDVVARWRLREQRDSAQRNLITTDAHHGTRDDCDQFH
jgi:hypothetical protein